MRLGWQSHARVRDSVIERSRKALAKQKKSAPHARFVLNANASITNLQTRYEVKMPSKWEAVKWMHRGTTGTRITSTLVAGS
jgi:hypothetical protein